jgi:acyl-CoA reductase-like NAD-dependent aldehyde dehydrogenase
MAHVTLELGGKSPNIVFADADLPTALDAASRAILVLSGQACVAGSRLLVEDAIHDEFVERLGETFTELARTNGETETVAPLISGTQFDRVRGYIEAGIAEGATLVAGDQPEGLAGYYVAPTLFDDVKPEMRIFKEEIFGPVLAVTPFSTEEEAVRLANATQYGLAAGLWTGSVSRMLRVIPQLEVGMVYANGYLNAGVEAPFGGFKVSGLGKEKGRLSMLEYSRVKAITISY